MRILPVIALLAIGLSVWAEEVKAADLPAPVKATMDKVSKGAELTSIEKNTVDGKTIYVGKYINKKGKEAKVTVDEAGTKLENEKKKKAE